MTGIHWVASCLLIAGAQLSNSGPLPQDPPLLSGVSHPHMILVDRGELFVVDGVDGTKVLRYSLDDYRLLATVGGDGTDPGTFRVRPGHRIGLDVTGDLILITGGSKLAWFSRDGGLLREEAFPFWTRWDYKAVGDRYAALGGDPTDHSYVLNVYGPDLDQSREIIRVANPVGVDRKIHVLTTSLQFDVDGDEIYAWGFTADLVVNVYDATGRTTRVLAPEYRRIPVTDAMKGMVVDSYRSHPAFKEDIEQIRTRLVFPDSLPAVWNAYVDDGLVYVMTYWRSGDDGELLVFRNDANISGRLRFPISLSPSHSPYPSTVSNGNWYQLTWDDERSGWALHVRPLRY